ncbi:Sugar phosphate isomerase/epimerase [Gracilibacillus ureilyticus]|uniref:Sugar phosphate isomerase/epimerase n=1 Tax=Gracilibacillus ureilyticus TaxID=531814 RepID=A0A1H9P4H9_9BACI|nr:sugar phosphate isomerase/epimerase [Gracilibacillus ureilyticus]SER42967.1 Sugar phosphate isomerase/epimerase [Gracilibacillus ureilyticus]
MEKKFAAQLYTLRNELKEEGIRPVFKKLKEMGWTGVQISALPKDYDPEEVALALEENNLKAAGMHIGLKRLQEDLNSVLKEANLYGTKDIICPFLSDELRNETGYREVKETLNNVAKQAQGYRISYHNHDFEFNSEIDGQDALSFILNPQNDNKILAEIDVFWVKKGGYDPVEFISPYSDRMPIIHLKDMTKDDRQTFAEVGEGVIDFLSILKWGEANGIEWYAVEQDVCERSPFDCLQTSLNNLKRLAKQMSHHKSEAGK